MCAVCGAGIEAGFRLWALGFGLWALGFGTLGYYVWLECRPSFLPIFLPTRSGVFRRRGGKANRKVAKDSRRSLRKQCKTTGWRWALKADAFLGACRSKNVARPVRS